MKKVLLIYPPTTIEVKVERKRVGIPNGIFAIAAVLVQEGYKVKILDATLEDFGHEEEIGQGFIRFGMSFAKIKEVISGYAPDVVGVSSLYSSQACNVHEVCRLAKEASKEILTVVGGGYPTSETQKCLDDPNIDFVVRGEGERAIINLLRDDLGHHQKIVDAPFIEDVNSLPLPARHLVDFAKYSSVPCAHGVIKHKPFASLFSSRGCPFNCSFCFSFRMHGTKFRARSPENILDEIELLIKDYGVKEIHFEDDNLTFDRQRALEVFQGMIDRKFNISWMAPSGLSVNKLDKELLLKMKESGCYAIIIAIESGNQRVLSEIMHKPVDLKRAEEIVRFLKEIELDVASYWMIGLPGETKREIFDTIDFAAKLKSINPNFYSSFSIFTPFKGTPLYDVCLNNKYLTSNNFSKMKYSTGVIDTEDFSHQWVEKVRYEGWLKANHAKSEEEVDSSLIPKN
ncbi:MAG: B12-binding domain-containing radical SAM protein [Candidatus Omnitrophica bacterium]|nr:B12-binding domain-containing radical SAM protein [Candidatus Omnitrophota bacterium]